MAWRTGITTQTTILHVVCTSAFDLAADPVVGRFGCCKQRLCVKDNPALEPRLTKKANRKEIGAGVIDKREPQHD
jgi:hypothetical protein